MPSTENLKKKHVMFKLRDAKPIEGTVFSTETHGIWIQIAKNTKMPEGVDIGRMGLACIFIPFYQLEWLHPEILKYGDFWRNQSTRDAR